MAEKMETAADRSAAMNEFREGKVTGKDIINMPVVVLDNGDEVGRVHDVVYNPREGKLVGVTIPHNVGIFSHGDTLWLDAANIHAVGADAIVVQDINAFRKYDESASKIAAAAGESIVGKRLMTDDGSFLGAVDDILIERQSMHVVAYEVSGGLWADMMKGQTDVPVHSILTIGEDVVVVPASVKPHIEEASGGLAAVAAAAQEKIVEFKDTTAEKIEQVRTEVSTAIESKEADYALGKTAGRTVYLDDANSVPLVHENEVITGDHIARAISAGKMHALAIAAGMQQTEDTAAAASAKINAAVETARTNISTAATAMQQKASNLAEEAKDRYGDSLIGKTTGRAVVSDSGVVLVPAGHVITTVDVESAKVAGKLADLSGAVGAGMVDSAKENIAGAYDSAKTRLAEEQASYEAQKEAARAREAAAMPTTTTALADGEAPRNVVIASPQNVIVQPPASSTSNS